MGPGLQYVSGVTDLEVSWRGGAAYLYSTTGYGGGATVFSIASSGITQVVDQVEYSYDLMASPSAQIEFLEIAGQTQFVAYGRYDWLLEGLPVDNGGQLGSSVQLNWGAGGLGNLSALGSTSIGGVTHVYAANANSTGFAHYTVDGSLQLVVQNNLSAPSSAGAIDMAALEVVMVEGSQVLLSLSRQLDGLKSYAVNNDGNPDQVSVLSSGEMLPVAVPTALTTGTVAGQTFAVVASSGSSSLTVLKVHADGTLEPVDHVIDNLWTRFQNTSEITSVQVGDRMYVIAGGADDGLSLFTLLPDGKLILLDTIADSHATALQNIASLSAGFVGGKIQVYATSETESGITQFEVDVGAVGLTVQADGSADQVTGTAQNDLIDGGSGNDQINGAAGDDILHDGTGQDQLTGGAGADIFLLTADDVPDTIMDFEPGIDRLDLSGFFMLYDASQLNITSRSWGADITYRNEVVHVFSASGAALTAQHFTTKDTLALDRPPSGFNYIPEVIEGTEGDDILAGDEGVETLKGHSGNDTFLWSEGADFFDGGNGEDTVSYVSASAAVTVDLTRNDSNGAAVGDQYTSIENLIGSGFGDILIGNNLANEIYGGSGDDTIVGGFGADMMDGGTGWDTVSYETMDQAVIISLLDNLAAGAAHGHTLVDIEAVTGSSFHDALTGNAHANTLIGLAGDDTLIGGAGDDHLLGGAGNDTLIGGEGTDILDGGAGFDWVDFRSDTSAISVNLAPTSSFSVGPGDTLISIENVTGSLFSDTIIGDAAANHIRGMAGDDNLQGGGGNDTLVGGDGRDTLYGGAGLDRIQGDDGDDRLFGDDGNDGLLGGAGDDWIYGGYGNDKISGGEGNDQLVGGSGQDVIWGGNGHDRFIGGGGDDRYLGGSGWDSVDYSAIAAPVKIFLAHGKGMAASSTDRFHSIENAIGSDFHDLVVGSNGSNRIEGRGGNDDLRGQAGADQLYGDGGRDRLSGGTGNDRLFGGDHHDILKGDNGHDILDGGAGYDRLFGGTGWDTASYATADAAVIINLIHNVHAGGAFGDKLYSIENIFGSEHDDTIIGSKGSNSLFGGQGNDKLKGMGGNDKLYGGDGDDIFIAAGHGTAKYEGGNGEDTVLMSGAASRAVVSLALGKGFGSMAGYTFFSVENLIGTDFADKFVGNEADNRLLGLNGDDILWGAAGNDALFGGSGNDRLNGNSGADILSGGSGMDVLSGDDGDDLLTGGEQVDTFIFTDGQDCITDFDHDQETILLSSELWCGGHKTQQEILSHANIIDGDAVFDFGNGNILTVDDIDQIEYLHNNVFLM